MTRIPTFQMNTMFTVAPQTQALSFSGSDTKKDRPAQSDVFCKIWKRELPNKIVAQNDTFYAITDIFPVTPGHMLVASKAHIPNYFNTDAKDRQDMGDLLLESRKLLLRALEKNRQSLPEGWNIGIDNGSCAGQAIQHLHAHLIPRYPGDVKGQPGGVRGVIPRQQFPSGTPDFTADRLFD